jgi:hypothetical protein
MMVPYPFPDISDGPVASAALPLATVWRQGLVEARKQGALQLLSGKSTEVSAPLPSHDTRKFGPVIISPQQSRQQS